MIRGAMASTRSLSGAMASTRGGGAWTPESPTTGGGVLPHTWLMPGVANFQDVAKTIPADEIGDVIGAAVNQGSDTYDVTQATTAAKPTLQQVTINSVTSYVGRYDGVDDYLQGAFGGGAISQPFTVFAVAQAVVDGVQKYLIESTDPNNRIAHFIVASTNQIRLFSGSSVFGPAADTNFNTWMSVWTAPSVELWLNGVLEAFANLTDTTPPGITVGAYLTGSARWKGDIGQILIYPGNISTADKNQVGEYLERVTGIVWTTI